MSKALKTVVTLGGTREKQRGTNDAVVVFSIQDPISKCVTAACAEVVNVLTKCSEVVSYFLHIVVVVVVVVVVALVLQVPVKQLLLTISQVI